jgi:hypothetical protein
MSVNEENVIRLDQMLEKRNIPTPPEPQQEALTEHQKLSESHLGGEFLRSFSSFIRSEILRFEKRHAGFVKISILPNRQLKNPLDAVVEPDDDGYIARTTDLPLYGYGDDPIEAVDALKCEIESLYNDLMQDDMLTNEWIRIKKLLRDTIVEE